MPDARTPLASRLNYAQVWEDWRLLAEVLPETGHLLSIASAGDNALALALRGATVTALDLSVPQIAVTELKLAGRFLDYLDFRALLGVDPHPNRLRLYRAVAPHLSEPSRAFWEGQHPLIAGGILGGGRFERYLATFRTRVLPLVHRPSTTRRWLAQEDLDAQRAFYDDVWDNRRWRALFRVFFSRRVMAALGRSPEQFAHVQGEVGDVLLGRARRVLRDLPVRDNGYVQWMLTGAWASALATPPYLTEAGHRALGDVSERVRLVHGAIEDWLPSVADGAFDGFNLSNLFEYLDEPTTARILAGLARVGRPGARIAYWNLFVDRQRPEALADRLQPLPELAAAAFARDRAFVYGAFRVEEVR